MGYFKQQHKDLTTWCINGINQPNFSYDMIYGGFQSMGVPLNHPFQMGIFHENHPASLGYPHDYGTPHSYEKLLGISRTIAGSIGSCWFGALNLDLQVGFVEPDVEKRRGKAMVSITWTSDLMLKHGPTGEIRVFLDDHRQIERRWRWLFRRLFARVGYVWGIKGG